MFVFGSVFIFVCISMCMCLDVPNSRSVSVLLQFGGPATHKSVTHRDEHVIENERSHLSK